MTQHNEIVLDRSDYSASLNSAADSLRADAEKALKRLLNKDCPGSEFTGWIDWPKNHGIKLANEIITWRDQLKVSYDCVVVIGIGGSYLGTRAVVDLLTPEFLDSGDSQKTSNQKIKKVLFAGHNMSETSLSDLLGYLEHRKPMICVVSKSGTTTEPGVAFRVLNEWCRKKFGHVESTQRIVAITDPKQGALRKFANDQSYKAFDIPSDVGGRYSVFTAVGLVPIALAGFNIHDFVSAADEVFANALGRTKGPHLNFILEYAQCRQAAWRAGKIIEVVTYPEPRMRNLVEWFKQLFGESDGKNNKGLFPGSLECTMDLHSMGQYLQEGSRTMIETFMTARNPRRKDQRIAVPKTGSNIDELLYLEGKGIDDINAIAVKATKKAHSEGGVPALEISLPDLEITTIARLFAALQISCPVGGLMMGINPFDQPGVEAYKKNMFAMLGKPAK
ncbi:MAG: glucose-6-phosphate isomerase [Proteobacteria bacterium]|nr:glucose-6-phosphate isomerase [Pseudomonadota bacterium]